MRIHHVDSAQPLLHLEVVDTGIGISESAQPAIFSQYSQADASTSRRYGGTGLGLSISRQLVLLMGGGLGLTSRMGEGSCFWFEIPVEIVEGINEDTPLPKPSQSAPEGFLLLQNAHVLVAEENAVNQIVIAGMLDL